jgi:hypothetical protein
VTWGRFPLAITAEIGASLCLAGRVLFVAHQPDIHACILTGLCSLALAFLCISCL